MRFQIHETLKGRSVYYSTTNDIADLIFSLVSIHKMLQETVGIKAGVK